MLLPTKIKGRNKVRDAGICLRWEQWHNSDAPKTELVDTLKRRLAERFKLTQRRIDQILITNHFYIPIDKEREKWKRINWLRRSIAKKGDRTQKDAADLIEMLRKEIDGDKPLIDQSTHITKIDKIQIPMTLEKEDWEKFVVRLNTYKKADDNAVVPGI